MGIVNPSDPDKELPADDPDPAVFGAVSGVLNSLPVPAMLLSKDLHIVAIAPSLRRLVGIEESVHGLPLAAVPALKPDQLTVLLRDVVELLHSVETKIQAPDGRWLQLLARPYRSYEDKIEGVILIVNDIDELQQTERTLVQRNNVVHSILDHLPSSVALVDADCRVMEVNKAFSALTRLKSSEVVGRSFPDLVRTLWSELDMSERLSMLQESHQDSSFTWEHTSVPDRRRLCFNGYSIAVNGIRLSLILIEDVTRSRIKQQQHASHTAVLQGEVESVTVRLQRSESELKRLTSHLFQSQEEEKKRIARDLHDDLGQRLGVAMLKLANLRVDADQAANLEALRLDLDRISSEVRKTAHQLHPAVLDELGLVAALRALVDDFGVAENMPTTVSTSQVPDTVSDITSIAVYRITQEALRNISKHAGKTHVKLKLSKVGSRLVLEILDNGNGFDEEFVAGTGRGLGLVSMKERARLAQGSLRISSGLGVGTSIVAEFELGAA